MLFSGIFKLICKRIFKKNNSVSLQKKYVFQKSAYPQSLSPLGHSDGFASCKAWCVLISASLPKTPFPGKGCVCFVGSASCRAFGHTRPASVPGLSVGLPPLDPVGGYAPATPFLSTIEVYRQSEGFENQSPRIILHIYFTISLLLIAETSALTELLMMSVWIPAPQNEFPFLSHIST